MKWITRLSIAIIGLLIVLSLAMPASAPALASPDTEIVQPSAKDTYLSQPAPDYPYGSATTVFLQDRSAQSFRPILEFDISTLPECVLTSATLQLYYYDKAFTDPVGKTVWAYKLTRTDWVEAQATWNSYKSGNGWASAGGDYVTSSPAGGSTTFPADYGWMSWNVLAIVQNAYSLGIPAEFLIKFETEQLASDYSMAYFYSKEYTTDPNLCPKLVIEYEPFTSPSVTTNAATYVEETTATLNGEITATGGINATTRGFEWDIDSGESYANDWHEHDGFGVETFNRGITQLTKGELYYYRAYATNIYGTGYGSELTFLTKPDQPTGFTATVVSGTQINLTWTKGTGAQNTYIYRKVGSYPADRTEGILVYSNTGTSYNNTGLIGGKTYYYRAWSYATEGGLVQYSDSYAQGYATPPLALKQHIVYQRSDTFNDLSDYDNDASPTFRTESSDPNVTAVFQNFRPLKEARCTVGLAEETPEMLTEIPEGPTEFYREGEVEHLPGAKLINTLLDKGGIPHDLFWIPFCFGLAAVAATVSYHFLKSMMFIAIIGGVIILFFALTGVIPLWTFFIYAIIAAGVLVSERVFGW